MFSKTFFDPPLQNRCLHLTTATKISNTSEISETAIVNLVTNFGVKINSSSDHDCESTVSLKISTIQGQLTQQKR